MQCRLLPWHNIIISGFWISDFSLVLLLFIVGIGNTSEASYIKAFASTCVREGFQVAVLNHLGGLEHVALTGNRIYTYGLLCTVASQLTFGINEKKVICYQLTFVPMTTGAFSRNVGKLFPSSKWYQITSSSFMFSQF